MFIGSFISLSYAIICLVKPEWVEWVVANPINENKYASALKIHAFIFGIIGVVFVVGLVYKISN